MPELPEVETVRRHLLPQLANRRIEKARFLDQRALPFMPKEDAADVLSGRTILDIQRVGKYLLFRLDEQMLMVIHLRMTGRLYVLTRRTPPDARYSAWIQFDHGTGLCFQDTRRFGTIYIGDRQQLMNIPGLANLGPDPTNDDWTGQCLLRQIQKRRAPIKSLLLNQTIVAGIGNIYADESLFCAGIHPLRMGMELTAKECDQLARCIKNILHDAIAFEGTTFRDFRLGYDQSGSFQERLQVYGRTGESCRQCSGPITKLKIAGRSSHYCSVCQPK